ncbi:MAG: tetratricopeptide repeat protein [Hyphomicrobium sp.]|nr:tetratricopeptide repeat protein [Hyphomicrobium sp.]
MSDREFVLIVAACLTLVTSILFAVRIAGPRGAHVVARALDGWLGLPDFRAAIVLTMLAAVSGYALAKPNQSGDEATRVMAGQSSETIRGGSPTATLDVDSTSLDALKAYADGLPNLDSTTPAWTSNAKAPATKDLPDVDTMIERLARRLEADKTDKDGWKMLGWSYFNTERYSDAVKAYETALNLDPASAELRIALDEARRRASSSGSAASVASTKK